MHLGPDTQRLLRQPQLVRQHLVLAHQGLVVRLQVHDALLRQHELLRGCAGAGGCAEARVGGHVANRPRSTPPPPTPPARRGSWRTGAVGGAAHRLLDHGQLRLHAAQAARCGVHANGPRSTPSDAPFQRIAQVMRVALELHVLILETQERVTALRWGRHLVRAHAAGRAMSNVPRCALKRAHHPTKRMPRRSACGSAAQRPLSCSGSRVCDRAARSRFFTRARSAWATVRARGWRHPPCRASWTRTCASPSDSTFAA
jgi:hypothetical protein